MNFELFFEVLQGCFVILESDCYSLLLVFRLVLVSQGLFNVYFSFGEVGGKQLLGCIQYFVCINIYVDSQEFIGIFMGKFQGLFVVVGQFEVVFQFGMGVGGIGIEVYS